MIIYGHHWFSQENQRFERSCLENHWFPKENWHRGGTEEEEITDGRAASAIVTRKSKISTKCLENHLFSKGKLT